MSKIFIYNCYQCKKRTIRPFSVTYNIEKELCMCCIKFNEKKYNKEVKKITKSKKTNNNKYSGSLFSHNPLFRNSSCSIISRSATKLSYRKLK